MTFEQVIIAGLILLVIQSLYYVLRLRWTIEGIAKEMADLRNQTESSARFIFGARRRGIYVIHCIPTDADYFGSTRTNFMARWGQHIRDLDAGRHVNTRLQSDWNEHGRDAFVFIAYEIMDDDAAIVARENEILDHRAMHVPAVLNYNIARTRTHAQPVAPDIETVFVEVPRRSRVRRPRYVPTETPGVDLSKPFSFEDLGLTPEEIDALNLDTKD